MKIAIDIGHTPASSASSEYANEYASAKLVADKCQVLLAAKGHETRIFDYPTVMSNNEEFRKVVKESNAWGAELFVSFHCDSSSNTGAHGGHVCYYSREGRKMAVKVAAKLCPIMSGRSSKTMQRLGLYVLKYTRAIAVLVELGFVSNEDDARKLAELSDELASAVADGIDSYASARKL